MVRVEPGTTSLGVMGLNMMSDRRSPEVVEAAIDETVRAIAENRVPVDLIHGRSNRGDIELTSIS